MPWHAPQAGAVANPYAPRSLVRITSGPRTGQYATIVEKLEGGTRNNIQLKVRLARAEARGPPPNDTETVMSVDCEPIADGSSFHPTAVWDGFDREGARSVNTNNRHAALSHLGTRDAMATTAAQWSRDQAMALRRVFDKFDTQGVGDLDADALRSALSLMRLGYDSPSAHRLILEYVGAAEKQRVSLAAFRELCARLFRIQQHAQPLMGASGHLLSKDDGGPQAKHDSGDAGDVSGGGGGGGGGGSNGDSAVTSGRTAHSSRPGSSPIPRGGMALNESAVKLEVDHVRRCLLGRALNCHTTPEAVVHEHIAYKEGLARAMQGQRASWELHLLKNRELVKLRGARGSVWRQASTGRARTAMPSKPPSVKPPRRSMTQDEIYAWADKMDQLQQPWGKRK